MKILNKEQIRASEKACFERGVSYDTMMINAGEAAAKEILRRYSVCGKTVTVVCGNGNNGGDGFVIAEALSMAGAIVEIVLPMGEPKTETAKNQFCLSPDITVKKDLNTCADIIIDALFGIGLDRPVIGELCVLFEQINSSKAIKIAIDIPSGVMCDGGIAGSAVKADLTLTMIAAKPCFFLPPSNEYCGEVVVLNIGIEPKGYEYLTTEAPLYAKRAINSHKGTFGTALLVCGSYGMCGAEILAARGALRSGAGIVKAVVCDKNYAPFCSSVPEAVTLPFETDEFGAPIISPEKQSELLKNCNSVLIGCGIGSSENMKKTVFSMLSAVQVPIVIDADGINAVASDISIIKKIKAPMILTPHPGEMARLCNVSVKEIERDRIGVAKKFALENNCILVLKGANTIIASPDGQVFFNTSGNAGMATGGSGDVLAGIIAGLLAQGENPLKAACDAVWLHGNAADRAAKKRGERSMLPSDIIDELIMPEE